MGYYVVIKGKLPRGFILGIISLKPNLKMKIDIKSYSTDSQGITTPNMTSSNIEYPSEGTRNSRD